MKSPKTITATVAGLALVVSLAAPALAQQRSATGYLQGDSQSLGLLMNMAEQNRMNVQTLGETVNNHELRLDEIEIKAVSEIHSVTATGSNAHQRAECPAGFQPFACFAQFSTARPDIAGTLIFGEATRQGCRYSPAAIHGKPIISAQASCIKIGITAAAVGGAETGGQ